MFIFSLVATAVLGVATVAEAPLPLPKRAVAREVQVHNLWNRQVPYAEALAWQRELHAERVAAAAGRAASDGKRPGDALLVMQHPPVLTLGTSSTLDNVRSRTPPFELLRTERGGEVTYHGPGQPVLYPVLDLRAYRQDVHWYMRALEEVAVRTLGDFGVEAWREPGLTGVWTGGGKACAIGVKLSRWVSMHGLALNVAPDLAHFEHIVPCGIADRPVTSVAREMESARLPSSHDDDEEGATSALLDAAQRRLLSHFADVFDVTLTEAAPVERE